MKSLVRVLLLSTVICLSSEAFSQPSTPNTSTWHFYSMVYLWALNMGGKVAIHGQQAHVKASFGDILRDMKVGGMLWLNATHGRVGIFFNGLYSVLDSKATIENTTEKSHAVFSILSAGLSYRIYERVYNQQNGLVTRSFAIVPYAGLRYTLNDVKVTIGSNQFNDDESWLQPLVGSRFILQFATHWFVSLSGDFAMANSNNYSANVIGLLSYKKLFGWRPLGMDIGYRFMHQYYKSGAFKWDMDLFGPVVGFTLQF